MLRRSAQLPTEPMSMLMNAQTCRAGCGDRFLMCGKNLSLFSM
jgi:hypothetical protein